MPANVESEVFFLAMDENINALPSFSVHSYEHINFVSFIYLQLKVMNNKLQTYWILCLK